MRVHVVFRGGRPRADGNILERLCQALLVGLDASCGHEPAPGASVNYFFPYLERHRYLRWSATPTAAWFTHRESPRRAKAKVAVWDAAAGELGLRLASAPQYARLLAESGPAGLVTPPLDREKFRPAPRAKPARPRVGVSGFIYPTGRKGERLVKLAAEDPRRADGWELVAAGHGWPVPTRQYAWAELERFYQGLDVYWCPSEIEGIGYGPLEALACGVPCVLPLGVGLFDDLGEAPGLYRYRAEDYGDAMLALERAVAEGGDPEALRALTEPFTAEAWVQDHREAFRRLLAGKAAGLDGLVYAPAWARLRGSGSGIARESLFAAAGVEPEHIEKILPPEEPAVVLGGSGASIVDRNPFEAAGVEPRFVNRGPVGTAGIYTVAYGEPARQCVRRLIASARQYAPGLPLCLVSDEPLGAGEDYFVCEPDSDIGARGVKTRIYDLAPSWWERVLYLDADTELTADPAPLLAILEDGWDWLMVPNPAQYHLAAMMRRPDNQDEVAATERLWGTGEFLQYNGGVFAFRRSPATERFCHLWHEEWNRWGKRDQAAFDRALLAQPLRLWTLGKPWNLVDRYGQRDGQTAVWHHPTQARRTVGIVAGRGDSAAAWQAIGVRR